MTITTIVDIVTYIEPVSCLVAIATLTARKLFRKYAAVLAFLVVRLVSFIVCVPIISLARHTQRLTFFYPIYFYTYWISFAVEAVLGFFIIYGIYNLAMAPLPGLQRLGRLMFRWAAAISLAMAAATALGPKLTSVGFMTHFVSQLQQTQSVLTLCMLLFVCFTIRPMGLSYGSKIFGVSLGLGILAATQLVTAAWFSSSQNLYSGLSIITGVVSCLSIFIWAGYFVAREPKRRMILLPTTSPFLRWNQISAALGDDPGFVALGEVTEDMLAPAEAEIMRRAAAKISRMNSAFQT